ncbi:MAG: potassium channel family protein [Thermoplasmata archaeon]
MTLTKRHFTKIVSKLVSLKDTSELMIDLAYSSLLLNSRELAEEVQALEEYMDNLHTEFELLVLSSGFKPEESKDFLGLIRLGVVTEEIADAAMEIADVVLRGLEPHPVLRRVIEEAEETVARVQVSETSSLVGKKLRDAQIPEETGMWVLVIRRGKEWLRPRPETLIKAGDILIASGYAEGEEDFKELASGIRAPVVEKT